MKKNTRPTLPGNDGWVLVSETGVDSKYCASHLSDADTEGRFTIAFPMPEENNGNGSATAGLALPGTTPWRTITVGDNLKPIVETTVPWDVVEPRFTSEHTYKYGKGTWSWIGRPSAFHRPCLGYGIPIRID